MSREVHVRFCESRGVKSPRPLTSWSWSAANAAIPKAYGTRSSRVISPMGLRLSVEKTRVFHIDEGFDFLGWHIQRHPWRGRAIKKAVYTYPSKKALASVVEKVRSLTRRTKHRTLGHLLFTLNRVLQGWCNYFRHGASSKTFGYIDYFTFWRVVSWLRKRHVGLTWKTLVRRFLPRWEVRDGKVELFRPRSVPIVRYRFRGTRIPTPWTSAVA